MNRRPLRHIALAATASLTFGLLAACGGGSESGGSGDDGEITVYSSLNPETSEALVNAFKKKYPDVEIGYLRLQTGALTVRFQEERDAGVPAADVVIAADATFFADQSADGAFETLDEDAVPALAEWPEEPTDGTYVSVVTSTIGISYNTDLVKGDDIPTEWADLLDPKFSGKILLADPGKVPVYTNLFAVLREEYGNGYLEDLAGQDLRVVDSSVPGAQQLAAGEASILVPNVMSVTETLKADGAPVETVMLSPTVGTEFHAAIAKDAPQAETARLFLDFVLSEEGQTIIAEAFYGASKLGDLPGSVPFPEGFVQPDVPWAMEQQAELLQLLGLR